MITIKKNNKPDLPICKMNCDKKLDSKLDDYDVTKFLNCHSINLLVGRSGSGKTSLLYSLFKSKKCLNKVYDKIIIFQPSASRESMNDKLFNQLPEEQLFEDLTLENLQMAEDMLEDEGNTALIFDDQGAYLRDKELKKKFKELVYNRRHKHLSIFFLVQTYKSVEKDLRKLFSNLFIFKVAKQELENIMEELVELPKDLIPKISKTVFDKQYNFLFVNTDSGRMFKNFDEIIIT